MSRSHRMIRLTGERRIDAWSWSYPAMPSAMVWTSPRKAPPQAQPQLRTSNLWRGGRLRPPREQSERIGYADLCAEAMNHPDRKLLPPDTVEHPIPRRSSCRKILTRLYANTSSLFSKAVRPTPLSKTPLKSFRQNSAE